MNPKPAATAVLPPDDDEDEILSVLLAIEDGTLVASPRDAARLTGYLGHERKPVRRRAGGALATAIRSGAIAAEACEALLQSPDATLRWGAAFALSRAGLATEAVIDVALATLDSGDGDVRWAAASIVITAARESDALRTRLRNLVGDGTPTMRNTVPSTLRKMALLCLADGGEREVPVCLRALRDEDSLVRLAALTTLGRVAAATPAVLAAVTAVADADTEAPVRRAATAILARLAGGDPPKEA